MPWRTHCLIEPDERAWADRLLLRSFASRTAMATSSSDIGVSSAAIPVISSPERLSFIVSTPYLIKRAHRAPNLLGTGDDDAEIEAFVRDVGGSGVAEAADSRDLRPCGQIARAGYHALIDGVADDDVEAGLGRGRAASRGEAGVQHELGHLRGDQRMLLGRHHLDRIDPRRIVPR